jgi:hypothetical protein
MNGGWPCGTGCWAVGLLDRVGAVFFFGCTMFCLKAGSDAMIDSPSGGSLSETRASAAFPAAFAFFFFRAFAISRICWAATFRIWLVSSAGGCAGITLRDGGMASLIYW